MLGPRPWNYWLPALKVLMNYENVGNFSIYGANDLSIEGSYEIKRVLSNFVDRLFSILLICS